MDNNIQKFYLKLIYVIIIVHLVIRITYASDINDTLSQFKNNSNELNSETTIRHPLFANLPKPLYIFSEYLNSKKSTKMQNNGRDEDRAESDGSSGGAYKKPKPYQQNNYSNSKSTKTGIKYIPIPIYITKKSPPLESSMPTPKKITINYSSLDEEINVPHMMDMSSGYDSTLIEENNGYDSMDMSVADEYGDPDTNEDTAFGPSAPSFGSSYGSAHKTDGNEYVSIDMSDGNSYGSSLMTGRNGYGSNVITDNSRSKSSRYKGVDAKSGYRFSGMRRGGGSGCETKFVSTGNEYSSGAIIGSDYGSTVMSSGCGSGNSYYRNLGTNSGTGNGVDYVQTDGAGYAPMPPIRSTGSGSNAMNGGNIYGSMGTAYEAKGANGGPIRMKGRPKSYDMNGGTGYGSMRTNSGYESSTSGYTIMGSIGGTGYGSADMTDNSDYATIGTNEMTQNGYNMNNAPMPPMEMSSTPMPNSQNKPKKQMRTTTTEEPCDEDSSTTGAPNSDNMEKAKQIASLLQALDQMRD